MFILTIFAASMAEII